MTYTTVLHKGINHAYDCLGIHCPLWTCLVSGLGNVELCGSGNAEKHLQDRYKGAKALEAALGARG